MRPSGLNQAPFGSSSIWKKCIHGFCLGDHSSNYGLDISAAFDLPFSTPRVAATKPPFRHCLPCIGAFDPMRESPKIFTLFVRFVLSQAAVEPEQVSLSIDVKNLNATNSAVRGSCCSGRVNAPQDAGVRGCYVAVRKGGELMGKPVCFFISCARQLELVPSSDQGLATVVYRKAATLT